MGSLESAELISDQADKKDDTPSTQELVLSGPNSVNSGSGSRESLPRAPSRGTHGTGEPTQQPCNTVPALQEQCAKLPGHIRRRA